MKKLFSKSKFKKIIAILSIFVIAIIVVLANNSYAFFERSVEGSCVALEVGDLIYASETMVTLEAGEEMVYQLAIKGNKNTDSKYQVYYKTDTGTTTTVSYSSESADLPSGTIEKGKTKVVTLYLKNEEILDTLTISIGVRGGLVSNSVEDIELESGEYRVDTSYHHTTIAGKMFAVNDDIPLFGYDVNSGLYEYTENAKTVYYFRGDVTNNHVIFGGYCWEMVRTTKTGGVKVIYDGIPVEKNGVQTCTNTGISSLINTEGIEFNNTFDAYDNVSVGYMYGSSGASTYEATFANHKNSTIKSLIDDWFKSSELSKNENIVKIEDAAYCNDRSNDGLFGGYESVYYGLERLETAEIYPTLDCYKDNDKFTVNTSNGNGDLTYPVGLITADEAVLAGASVNNKSLTKSYLSIGTSYWTMTPAQVKTAGDTYGFVFNYGNSVLTYITVVTKSGVRPVISLSSSVKFVSGDGTECNPFVAY